jgi:hypothetical protein
MGVLQAPRGLDLRGAIATQLRRLRDHADTASG